MAVVSGQWSVVSGQWSVVSGQWSVVSGQWSVVSGQWSEKDRLVEEFCGKYLAIQEEDLKLLRAGSLMYVSSCTGSVCAGAASEVLACFGGADGGWKPPVRAHYECAGAGAHRVAVSSLDLHHSTKE
jgi:hypothetical protein